MSLEAEDDAGSQGLVPTISLFLFKYNKESIEFIRRICCNPWQQVLSKCEMCLIILEHSKLTTYLQNEDSSTFELVKIREKCIYLRGIYLK